MVSFPKSVEPILHELKSGFQHILADNLVGIYIHGSIAMECFNPNSSDIDFLIIVHQSLSLETKKVLAQFLIKISNDYPNPPLEMSILLQSALENFEYPTAYEFHFSKEWKKKMEAGEIDFSKEQRDPDLAAHLTITKVHGICLVGKPTQEVFFEIPKTYYLQSIIEDGIWCINNVLNGPDTGTCLVPTYAVLNFCRVIAYIHNKIITSKKSGGEWGMQNLPEVFHPVIQAALNEYTTQGEVEEVDTKILKNLALLAQHEFSKVLSN